MSISYSRQMNAAKNVKRKARVPSAQFGRLIASGSEDEIQATFFSWIDLHEERFPELKAFYAIPNAGKRSKLVGWLMKVTGMHAGVPDTHLPITGRFGSSVYDGSARGLWIEFKAPGKYPTPLQREWIERLRAAGHRVEVCRSWHEAVNLVIEYLGLDLPKL
jgi:hypothetical protein